MFYRPSSPSSVRVDLYATTNDVPYPPDITDIADSVTHVFCEPRVCGLRGDSSSAVSLREDPLVDGGSNICVTGDLDILVDAVDIPPIAISVAIEGMPASLDDCITKQGLLPLTMTDGSYFYQPCFYCANLVETIISPSAIVASSDVFVQWHQTGHKDPTVPGSISFSSADGLETMTFGLECRGGLYYCASDVYTVAHAPVRTTCRRMTIAPPDRTTIAPTNTRRPPSKYSPTTRARQVESEVWALRFGSPGEHQLDVLPKHVVGLPPVLEYHPFRCIDFKEWAYIRKQPAGPPAAHIPTKGSEFFMDFGFLRASADDYRRPNKDTDRIVTSYDGFAAYLLIVDGATRRVWVFLTESKEPPVDICLAFLRNFGNGRGLIRTDQGGELAHSEAFIASMLRDRGYVVEPTGADSPSQNGGAEIYNNTLAVKVRTLLYGSGLPAKFWSAALLHAVFLHNRLVHSATDRTPYEAWHGRKPNVQYLKTFGSRVCVKVAGVRRCKLDRHDFTGLFIGYTATTQNIMYLDLTSGIVKSCHHAIFDEAWYLQPTRPPAAQLLYDLGLEAESDFVSLDGPLVPTPVGTVERIEVAWPPNQPAHKDPKAWPKPPPLAFYAPLPLRITDIPNSCAARAARTKVTTAQLTGKALAAEVVNEFLIGPRDMEMIYMSSDPYGRSFEASIDVRKCDLNVHPTAGLQFLTKNNRLILAKMDAGTPGAKIDKWRTRLRGAWLESINGTTVSSVAEARAAFRSLSGPHVSDCTLLFRHPEVSPDISNRGVPIMSRNDFSNFSQFTHDQLNNRTDLRDGDPLILRTRCYDIEVSGDVRNYTTKVMRLTRGRLLQQTDWSDWQHSEYLQLNQYYDQKCFGEPTTVEKDDAVFFLVWTYNIKALDGRKKARCVCDGSSRSGSVKVLDEVYANCVDQTSSRLFYAVCAAENLIVYGSDVCNAFAEAPPPKQGFYIRPDRAFNEWWTQHKGRPPLQPGQVIPVLSAMQGHPESPRLWEKHADAILRDLGLTPTIHEPCLYSGLIQGKRVLFKRQVDDFAIGAPDQRTADILLDLLDDQLTMPIKRQGLLDMFNGIDVIQTRDYIKIDCHTYVDKFCAKYLDSWLRKFYITEDRPTPFPSDKDWLKGLNSTTGSNDPKVISKLESSHQVKYRGGVGELIWAMTTCRPDLAFASVKLSQSNSTPAEIHFHALKHAIRYLYATRTDGIYFWRTSSRPDLPAGPTPPVSSNLNDLLLDDRPSHDATVAVAYGDSDWATCVKTRRSFSGICIQLAGGTIAYKTKFQPTVALSTTEAEFMAACDVGRMSLFVRSILWDLDVPQEAATIAYEDNDGCTAMGNAQKPTTRTRHIDIKYFALCDWVERDLLHLERIDTSINIADHLTKSLPRILFHRHADFLLGHVPPKYSPVYTSTITTYGNTKVDSDDFVPGTFSTPDIDKFVPSTFTTPMTARAARVFVPSHDDVRGNPWLVILCFG